MRSSARDEFAQSGASRLVSLPIFSGLNHSQEGVVVESLACAAGLDERLVPMQARSASEGIRVAGGVED